MRALQHLKEMCVIHGFNFSYGAINLIPKKDDQTGLDELENIFKNFESLGLFSGWILHPTQLTLKIRSTAKLIIENQLLVNNTIEQFEKGNSKAMSHKQSFHDNATIETFQKFKSKFLKKG
jgi:hypothetical protein